MKFVQLSTGIILNARNEAVIEMMAASDAYEEVVDFMPVPTAPAAEPEPVKPKRTRKRKITKGEEK